jgi:ribose-phosphate pyrophosphokinase
MSYEIKKYPDGTAYVTIPKQWEHTTQEITFRMNNYESLWHLVHLCDVLTWNDVKAHIFIPNLLDAQADKRFNEFHSSGLSIIAKVLNEYEEISFGFYHPHNPEVVEALFSRVDIIDNSILMDEVLRKLSPLDIDNTILMSSDAGGFKPLMKLCDKIGWSGETYSAMKARKYEDGKSSLSQIVDREDFEGKDIIIIDDISVYGGTFKGLSKLLRERNCGKIYLVVSHMTVQNLGIDPVTHYFNKVFTTNSKFEDYWVDTESGHMYHPKNLEVIKLFY